MTSHLKSAYTHITKESIENLIDYFQKIGGNKLSVKCRRQNAFKTEWSNREIKLICRCHFQNAAEYLSAIKSTYTNEQIQVVIADIVKFVKIMDPNEDVGFIIISTNTLPSAIHFDIAYQLFLTHQIRLYRQNNYNIDILTIYSLRLSLECRIRGMLGIDYAINRGQNIGLATLIKISRGLESVEYSNDFNWDEIVWINDCLNHHIHRNIRPYSWVIFQAFEALKFFVDPKEPLSLNGRLIYSLYKSSRVSDETKMEEEIIIKLKQIYPEVEIKWLHQREILKK